MEKLPQIKEVAHRISSFDILRVFLLLLVINIHREHFTGAVALFPNRFGWYAVPAFIILSFYLTSNFYLNATPAVSSIIKRVKRFFVPFLFWSVLGFIVTPNAFNVRNIFVQLFTGGVINVPLYYLLIMAIFTVLFWILTFIPIKKRLMTMVVLAFISVYLQYSGINYGFFSKVDPAVMYCYGRIVELLPMAVTGILLGLAHARKIAKHHEMLLAGVVGGLYFATYNTDQPKGVDYSGFLLYFGSTFIFMYFWLVRHFRLPEKAEKVVSMLGAYSFGVYASHYLVFELLFKYAWSKNLNEEFPFLFLIVATAICYAIIIGLDKLTRNRFSYLFK
jgi:peptidoglycan/LPS O-acetylase OafA/YrhL